MTTTINQSVYALLASVAPLTAVVGTRIHAVQRPQETGELSAVTFLQIAGGEVVRAMGQAPGGPRLRNGIWQIDCWALTLVEARALGQLVFAGIDGYDNHGAVAGEIVHVELSDAGGAEWDETAKQFFSTDDYRIWWRA